MKESDMVTVTGVEVVEARTVLVRFSDGASRLVDLTPFLWGPAFEEIARDDAMFGRVSVDPDAGTIVWPNGADIAPEPLAGDHQPSGRSGNA
jgi:hypothetical protein